MTSAWSRCWRGCVWDTWAVLTRPNSASHRSSPGKAIIAIHWSLRNVVCVAPQGAAQGLRLLMQPNVINLLAFSQSVVVFLQWKRDQAWPLPGAIQHVWTGSSLQAARRFGEGYHHHRKCQVSVNWNQHYFRCIVYCLGLIMNVKMYLDVYRLNYKGYSMESRLHFRIHAALNTMGTSVAKLPPHRTSAWGREGKRRHCQRGIAECLGSILPWYGCVQTWKSLDYSTLRKSLHLKFKCCNMRTWPFSVGPNHD